MLVSNPIGAEGRIEWESTQRPLLAGDGVVFKVLVHVIGKVGKKAPLKLDGPHWDEANTAEMLVTSQDGEFTVVAAVDILVVVDRCRGWRGAALCNRPGTGRFSQAPASPRKPARPEPTKIPNVRAQGPLQRQLQRFQQVIESTVGTREAVQVCRVRSGANRGR